MNSLIPLVTGIIGITKEPKTVSHRVANSHSGDTQREP